MADNDKCLEILGEYRTLKYVKYGLWGAGLGMIVASLIGMDKDTPPNLGLLIGGGIVCNLSWIPHLKLDGKIEEAISTYNSSK